MGKRIEDMEPAPPAAVPAPENIEEEEHWMFTLGTDHESPDAPVKEEE
jgi:hypothetical protein